MQKRDDSRWVTNLNDTVEFYNKFGRLPKGKDRAVSSVGTELSSWLSNQRTFFKNGTLSADRRRMLIRVMGSVWTNYLQGITPEVEIPEIPDIGTDFSITTLYKSGIIDKKKYNQLYSKNILYLRHYLALNGEVSGKQIYDLLVSKGMVLPEWWMVNLYSEVMGPDSHSFVNIYKRQDNNELEALRKFFVAVMPIISSFTDKVLDVLKRYCSGESIRSISNSYSVTYGAIDQTVNKALSRIRFRLCFIEKANNDPLDLDIRGLHVSIRLSNTLARAGLCSIRSILEACDYYISDPDMIIVRLKEKNPRISKFGRALAVELSTLLIGYCKEHNISYK